MADKQEIIIFAQIQESKEQPKQKPLALEPVPKQTKQPQRQCQYQQSREKDIIVGVSVDQLRQIEPNINSQKLQKLYQEDDPNILEFLEQGVNFNIIQHKFPIPKPKSTNIYSVIQQNKKQFQKLMVRKLLNKQKELSNKKNQGIQGPAHYSPSQLQEEDLSSQEEAEYYQSQLSSVKRQLYLN